MKNIFLLIVCLLFASTVWSEELQVAPPVITTAINQQQPVDQLSRVPADFTKLYCFTRIIGAQQPTYVTHVWYFDNDEMARVKLPVYSSDWRTYSSKRLLPQWVGRWRVTVLDAGEGELASAEFVVE